MSSLSIFLLGPFQASLGQEPLAEFRTRKVQALLIYLATEPEPHSRDQLLNLLWPGLPEKSARSNLRQVLYYLRQSFSDLNENGRPDPNLIIANRQDIQLNPQADMVVDTWQFEQHLHRAHTHEHLDLFLCPECAAELEDAIALYRGDFVADFFLDDSNEYEEWTLSRREYFRRKALDTLSTLASIALRNRKYPVAQSYAEKQLEIDNLRETAYRQLMAVLALSGRREQALAVYEDCRRVLAEELGMAPTTRTTDYYDKILTGDLRFDHAPEPGVRGYELQEEIGAGTYGTIYRAVQTAIRREVAVKVIRRKYANDPEFIRRFESEAQTIARLEHPYIVPLYDYWRDPEGAYLAMRYMRGGSLLTELKSGPWDVRRTVSMLEQIAGALAIAHQKGVVHRDIKPGNILLDDAGNSYLADFGIAKDLAQEEALTVEGPVLGTLDYTSPEQIMSDEVTPQADIYSLGAVLYETLTGEKPFSYASIAKLLYSHINEPLPLVTASRPDIPVEIDAVLQKATAKKPEARYASVLELAAAFRQAALAQPKEGDARSWETIPALTEIENPYKGLHAFQEADVEDFFGREALVQQLVHRLDSPAGDADGRFLALVGPSGSGKSSVVKAGLIPALRDGALPGSDKWFITEMVPGANPLEELEMALWRVAVDPPPDLVLPMQRDTGGILRTIRRILPTERAAPEGTPQLLLVIDQFEELFTLVENETQRTFFLNSLLAALQAPRSPLRVLITLRADFYDRPLQYADWGQLLKENTEIILPLNRTELTWAIREPALRMGVRLEAGLAVTIVGDVADQPGALPLLQYALTELFERRNERRITRAAYEQLGGVQGALGQRAEAVFAELDTPGQEAARQLFLRLVTLGEGTEDTRRRVLRAEVEAVASGTELTTGEIEPGVNGAAPAMTRIIDRFGAARFLTFDHDPLTRAPTVEVAHEALLREWPRLRGWLEESRDDVRMQRLLAQAAAEWVAAGRADGYLLRDARLDQFAGWAETTTVTLTGREQDYLAVSLHARAQRLAAEEARRQKELATAQQLAQTEQARAEAERRRAEEQAQAAHSLRRRAVFLAGALVIAALLAVTAILAGIQANDNATLAATREAEALAKADQLSTAQAETEAERQQAEEQRQAAENAEATAVAEGARADTERDVALSAQADAEAARQEAENQARLAISRELSLAAINNLEADPQLAVLLSLEALETSYTRGAEEALHLALQAFRVKNSWHAHNGTIGEIVFTPDGSRMASISSSANVWDVQNGDLLGSLPLNHDFASGILAFDQRGEQLTSLTEDINYDQFYLTRWDILSGEIVITRTLPITSDIWGDYDFNTEGTLVAVGLESGEASLWDMETAQKLFDFPTQPGIVWDIQFSDDGSQLAIIPDIGDLTLWEVDEILNNEVVTPLSTITLGEEEEFIGATFSPSGTYLAVAKRGAVVELWALSDLTNPLLSLTGPTNVINELFFSPDERQLLAADFNGEVHSWDIGTGQLLYKLTGHDTGLTSAAFSPDGHTVATGDIEGNIHLWEGTPVADGELLTIPVGIFDRDLELSPNDTMVAVGDTFGPAFVFDAQTGELLLTLAGLENTAVYRVAFSPDSEHIATVGEDNVIRIWDARNGEVLMAWTGHAEGGLSGGFFTGTIDVVYSPDGKRLATAGTDGVAKVWDTATGVELLVLAGHTAGLHSIDYSPDGRLIATSSDQDDSSVKVWDAVTGAEIYSLDSQPIRGWGLTFSPDSTRLAIGGGGGVVNVWDMETGEKLYDLPPQVRTVSSVKFSPDGQQLISGGGDAVRIFDAATGEELQTISTVTGPMDITQDGRRIYVIFDDIRVFTVHLEDAITLAQERLTRTLTDDECRVYLHLEDGCPDE